MTPPPAYLGNFAAGSLGGASRSASFIQVPLNRGSDGISGSQGTDAVHNFTYQRAYWPRLVPVGFNGDVKTFLSFPIFHES